MWDVDQGIGEKYYSLPTDTNARVGKYKMDCNWAFFIRSDNEKDSKHYVVLPIGEAPRVSANKRIKFQALTDQDISLIDSYAVELTKKFSSNEFESLFSLSSPVGYVFYSIK